jgi:hypothetical protein
MGCHFMGLVFMAALIGWQGSIKHDEASATKTALQFARDAFVNQGARRPMTCSPIAQSVMLLAKRSRKAFWSGI